MSAKALASLLKYRFPWLGTNDSVTGSDVIQDLAEWYEQLLRAADNEELSQMGD